LNRHRREAPSEDRQRGYAVILTSLMLVPLLGFAGFAVDVGAWYVEASAIQKAADSAALAGVIWQPDFAKASAAAAAAAARNGFVDGVDGVIVSVTNSGSAELQVTITDTSADLYFSQLFLDNVQISRRSVAEYVLAVPLGSPKNYFGTRELITGSDNEGFSAAINGSCNTHANGGQREVLYLDNDAGSCNGSISNPDRVGPYSYQYYVDIPAAPSPGEVALYIRDPNQSGGPLEGISSDVTTTFRLRAPDLTPFDDTDNPVYQACGAGSRAGSSGSPAGTYTYDPGSSEGTTSLLGSADWDLFCRIPAGASGRFILEVGVKTPEDDSGWTNAYALLAKPNGLGITTCDTRSNAACPSVVANKWMSIFVNVPSSSAEFYLAEIGDQHVGKKMQIKLFDPGEGSEGIKIIEPGGAAFASFDWTSSNGYSGSNTTYLDVTDSKFNDAFVTITIQLPNDFDVSYGTTDRWWKIKYLSGTDITDRTTWSVEIIGDPVRLIR